MRKTHTVRTSEGLLEVSLTPSKAIKAKCMDCSGWQRTEVKLCTAVNCALWPFRGWWNYGVSNATPEQVEARRESGKRLAAARKGKHEPTT